MHAAAPSPAQEALTLDGVKAARARIAPHVAVTPVHTWRGPEIETLGPVDAEVSLKLELFQRSGSFKARGAVNSLSRLAPEALARGVTAVSAGNHAIAVAYAARRFGVSAKVVMMASADESRIRSARMLGADVLLAPTGAEAFALARRIEGEEGRALIQPFEGVAVAEGSATLAMELIEQAPDLDAVIIPVGGGGLAAGMAWAFKTLRPQAQVFGVEPVGADTMTRSLAAGSPQSRDEVATIATSLAPPFALPFTFGLCRDHLDEIVLVDDEAIMAGMGLLFREMKLAVEPAAAAATAALCGPLKARLSGRRVGVIVCGANITLELFCAYVGRAQAALGLK